MATVYTHSSLSFAATAASNGTKGRFHLRTPNMIDHSRQKDAKGMFCTGGTFLCSIVLSWDTDAERSPLDCRGWVLQERPTAPRTLHFGKSQIYWECRETWKYEQFPNVIPWWEATANSTRDLTDRYKPRTWWKNLVSEYSRRFLTEDDDEFVAISARASRHQAVIGDKMARASQVALLPLVQHLPTRTFSERLQNIYMLGMDRKKWSVDIVRGLLLESTEACGEYRRVGSSRMSELFVDESERGTCFNSLHLVSEASANEEVGQPDERGCCYLIRFI